MSSQFDIGNLGWRSFLSHGSTMTAIRWMPLLGFLFLMVGCVPPVEVVDTGGVETAIRELGRTLATYDFERTKALYEEEATWIEMSTEPIGLDNLSQRALPLQTLGVKPTWEPTNIRIANEGRVAWATWCWCPATFTVETESAARIMRQIFDTAEVDQREWQVEMMASAVLRKHDDNWLFVQGHVSQRAPRKN